MEQGLLSVIIPTYKREFSLIERAIISVEEQTYRPVEIWVIDDNREDSLHYSVALRQGLAKAHPGVKYAVTGDRHGAQAARNKGIAVSLGEFLAFLDDDDCWDKTLAEKEIDLLRRHPQAGMAYCMGYNVYEDTDPPRVTDYFTCPIFQPVNTFEDMLLRDGIGTTTQAIIRRTALEACGGFDEAFLARQDYEMWLRISQKYTLVGVPERLFYHYLHSGEQISRKPYNSIQGFEKLLEKYEEAYKSRPAARRYIYKNLIRLYRSAKSPKWLWYQWLHTLSGFALLCRRLCKK